MNTPALHGTLLALTGATLAGFALVRLVDTVLSRRERLAWSMGAGVLLLAGADFALGRLGFVPGPKKFAALLAVLLFGSFLVRRHLPRRAPGRPAAGALLATVVPLVLVVPFAVEAVRLGVPSRAHPEPWGLAARAIFTGALAHDPALTSPLLPWSLAGLASAVRAWGPHALALLDVLFAVATILVVSGFLARRVSPAAGGAAGVLAALVTPHFAGSKGGLPLAAAAFAVALVSTAALDALDGGTMADAARLLLASAFAVATGEPGVVWTAGLFLVLAARAAHDRRIPRAALAAVFVPLVVSFAALALGGRLSLPGIAALSRFAAVGPTLLATAAATAGVALAGIALVLLATPRGDADALIPAILVALGLSIAVASAAPLWRAEETLARSALALLPAIALVVASRVFAPARPTSPERRAPGAAGLGAALLVVAAVPWGFRAAAGEKRVDPAFVARPTFHASVEPILQAHCQTCHHDGGIAPFSLTTWAGAAERRRDVRRQVASRRMPPWKAKPGCERFSNDPSLSEKEIATLVRWADSGAKEGNPKDAPPTVAFPNGWELGEPDLVLKAPVFTPDFSKGDLYQCFVLPTGLEQNAWISAVEVRPGNRAMVHHALLYVEEGIQSREREAEGPGPGYPCFGGARVPVTDSFGEWAPGMQPRLYPPGTARFLPRKSRIIMQVHYSAMYGKVEPDASEVGVYFAKEPVHRRLLSNDVRADAPFTIPADAVSHTLRGRLGPLDSRAELVAILPHMHLLGKTMKVTARLPGGVEKCLVDVDDWDLRWQRTYYYEKPVVLPKGTVIDLEATFDNSYANPNNPVEPHVDVHFGEHTTDEMCMALLFWTVDGRNPGEREAFFKGQVCGTSPIPRPTLTPASGPH